jgi:hypothetical protein
LCHQSRGNIYYGCSLSVKIEFRSCVKVFMFRSACSTHSRMSRTHTTKNKRPNYGVNSLVVIMPTFSTHLRAAIAHNIVASTSLVYVDERQSIDRNQQ